MLNPNYHRASTVRRGFNIWVAYLEFGPEQPAPVAVALPERKTQDARNSQLVECFKNNWNACLDEITRLNAKLR